MNSANDTEKKLLEVSKQFDAALSECSAGDLKSTVSDDAVLHYGDSFML